SPTSATGPGPPWLPPPEGDAEGHHGQGHRQPLTADRGPGRLFVMMDDSSSLQNIPEDAQGVVSIVVDNVRRLGERAGLSLRELAARATLSTSTLSNLEAGTGNPGVETLVDISRALNVAFSELVTHHEPDVQVQRADEGVLARAAGGSFTSRLLV